MNRVALTALSGVLMVMVGCSGKNAASTGSTSRGTSSGTASVTASASTATSSSSGSHSSSTSSGSHSSTAASSTATVSSSSSDSSSGVNSSTTSSSGQLTGSSSSTGSATASSSSGSPQACASLPFTVSNGDLGATCTTIGDGGTLDCDVANGEFCLQFLLPDGGVAPDGFCSIQCGFGPPCPGTSICASLGSFDACLADCDSASTTGGGSSCPGSLSCNPTSPNAADPGLCYLACGSDSDCNAAGSGTTFVCSTGVCRCTTDSDCSPGACDTTNGACYTPCQGPDDFTTCQSGCCGEIDGTNYCDSNANPVPFPLCVSCFDGSQCASGVCDSQGFCNVADTCVSDSEACTIPDGGIPCNAVTAQCVCPNEIALQALCTTCQAGQQCLSGNCDSQGYCNLPATTLCSQTPGACANLTGSASCDLVTDNCTCPGEVTIADGGSCFSTPFNPFDDGDLGQPCQNLVDGGSTVCAAGEACSPLATDGGTIGPGYCVAFCDQGQPCPGTSTCLDGLECLPQCLVADGGGCPTGLLCLAQTPNPADPGTCSPPQCATNADCNGSELSADGGPVTAEVCAKGTCLCTKNSDCNGGVADAGPGAFACDLPSGVCYEPCGSQKSCGASVGGCCESLGGGRDYCNTASGSELALKPTCSSCVSSSECASNFCDPAGHCQVTDLCSQSAGECGFVGSTCVADNCACGEPDAGPNGGACYLHPLSVGNAGDLGGPCTVIADGGSTGCDVADGEFCNQDPLSDGGFANTGFCVLDCSQTGVCPASTTCVGVGFFADCLANCQVEPDGGSRGCTADTVCIRLSPDLGDPGVCYSPVCQTAADCNAYGTAFVCERGNCLCTTNDDCAFGGSGALCDAPSGQCYTPCGDNKECEIETGGCCEQQDAISFCDPNGGVLPDGGGP